MRGSAGSRRCSLIGLTTVIYGMQVLASVASYINRFTDRYMERTLESHSRAQGLLALRRASPEAYAIYSKLENSRWRSRVRKVCPPHLTHGVWFPVLH